MQVLFVHGLGRSPLCGAALLRHLRAAGWRTASFAYLAALESEERIVARLSERLQRLARRGEYAVIGHSLGGVLLRLALRRLPAGTRLPCQLVLIASPVRDARLARWSRARGLYRLFGGDCGALLASPARMKAIGAPKVPTFCVIGLRGDERTRTAFAGRPNDGLLAVSEVLPPWPCESLRLDDTHLGLPGNPQVAEQVLAQLAGRCSS